MGDGVKISKDKRHHSCCSVATAIDDVGALMRSECKLDGRASIAEVNDKFFNVGTRCDQLQQKINMIKCLKKKRKLKRRSARAETSEAPDNCPVISVQTKPKRKLTARAEERCAADEKITIIRSDNQEPAAAVLQSAGVVQATNDSRKEHPAHAASSVCCGESARGGDHSRPSRTLPGNYRHRGASRYVVKEVAEDMEQAKQTRWPRASRDHRQVSGESRDRAVVELFSRCTSPTSTAVVAQAGDVTESRSTNAVRASEWACPRHYEAATAASRMRRASRVSPCRRLPFVVSATIAPSHNLAVNLQKLLNSLKIQQPPRGIPHTLAHHLGLNNLHVTRVCSSPLPGRGLRGTVSAGAVGAGRSYARALNLLRTGDGPLARYLRSLQITSPSRNGAHDWDTNDYATDEAKRKLAEYAQLYRELERVDQQLGIRRGGRLGGRRDPALELRRRQLVAQLQTRDGKISEIVRKYEDETSTLRARKSASSAERSFCRQSQFKINVA